MDKLNQLGKDLKQIQNNAVDSLNRFHAEHPRIEHARDIFDPVIGFEMYFDTLESDGKKELSLVFAPPPSNCCCTQCYCAECEFFTGSTDPVLTTSHDMLDGTIRVFQNDIQITTWTHTATNEVTLSFTPSADDQFKVCYTYEIQVFGTISCDDAEPVVVTQVYDINHPEVIIGQQSQPGTIFGAVASLLYSTTNIKWAHATIENWFGSPPDTDTDQVQPTSQLYAVDGNVNTCSSFGPMVLRKHDNNQGIVEAQWQILFNQEVRICSLHIVGSPLYDVGFLASTPEGDQVFSGTVTPSGNGFDVTFDFPYNVSTIIITMDRLVVGDAPDETHTGPFGLFYWSGADLCEVTVSVISPKCIDLLKAGKLGL